MTKDNVWEYQYVGSKICLTQNLGVHDNLFGGNLLSWMDEIGALYSCFLIEDRQVVTKKFGDTIFHNPVKQSDIIFFYAKVGKIGNSSLTISIEVKKHNPRNGKEKPVCQADVTFVRIDEDGESMRISDRLRKKYLEQRK